MAFLSKLGNILKQTASRQINYEISASRPSIYQAIRSMSSTKLFVGGVSYQTSNESLKEAFSKYGEVLDARIIVDRDTGRSRGFGFVTFTSTEEASSAMQALDGQALDGRTVRVNFANENRRTGGGGFGGGGGYGAGGGYGGGGYGGGGRYGGDGGYGSGGGGGYGGGGYGGSGGGSYGGSGGGGYGGSGGYGGGNTGGGVGSGGGGAVEGNSWNDGIGASGGGAGSYADEMGGNDNTGGFGGGEGGYDGQPAGGNFQDDDNDDFAKRA